MTDEACAIMGVKYILLGKMKNSVANFIVFIGYNSK
jgi:hypothetical protein